jgi:hypothetical protein
MLKIRSLLVVWFAVLLVMASFIAPRPALADDELDLEDGIKRGGSDNWRAETLAEWQQHIMDAKDYDDLALMLYALCDSLPASHFEGDVDEDGIMAVAGQGTAEGLAAGYMGVFSSLRKNAFTEDFAANAVEWVDALSEYVEE